MAEIKKNTLIKLFYLLCFLGAACLVFTFINITYASLAEVDPSVTIFVDNDGNVTCNGSLFGKDLWYPGKEEEGVIRISSSSGVKINSLGFDVVLKEHESSYTQEAVYKAFLDNMILTVKQGRLLVFSHTLLDNASFSAIADKDGFFLDNSNSMTIGADDSLDLKYTLKMSEDAGDELENLVAALSFKVNVEQN